MKKVLVVTLVAATVFLCGAEDADAKGEASVYLGRTSAVDLQLTNMTTFGGSIGFFGTLIGVEFGLEYSPNSTFQVGPYDTGASIFNMMGNVVLQIPLGPFYPYGTIGYGWVTTSLSTDILDNFGGTVGAFNFGFGAKIYVSDSIGIKLDYRRFALQTNDDDPKFVIPLTGFQIDTNLDLNRIIGGVSFRF